MSKKLPYFKFVSALIDSKIWANLSPAAKTLYPVLLRFSDANYKPVYPGSSLLLKLTGFKQKSSLRRARKDLVRAGLISLTEGTGNKNTVYFFRFDWAEQGVETSPPRGAFNAPPGGSEMDAGGVFKATGTGVESDSPYNKIQISINNNVPVPNISQSTSEPIKIERANIENLKKKYGQKEVELAVSECKLCHLPLNTENLVKILNRSDCLKISRFDELKDYLQGKISEGSLRLIEDSFVSEKFGTLIFVDTLPFHLKEMIKQINPKIFFEPVSNNLNTLPKQEKSKIAAPSRKEFWRESFKNN